MAYDVFISFKRNALDGSGVTRDFQLAADLHRTLRNAGVEAFMSERDVYVSDFRRQIDDALDEAKILIAVGTSKENMDSENVRYEWWTFNDDILSGDKPDGQIFSYIEGMKKSELPRALRRLQFFSSDEKERLVAVVLKNLGKTAPKPKPVPEQKPVDQKPVSQPQPVRKTTPQPKPVSQPAQQIKPVSYKTLRVGDRIPFGRYPQGANGEVEPLMWRVLAVESGRALLITDKLIDAVPYNSSYENVTWETCTLRQWMNDTFFSTAFSVAEQEHIATVTIPNRKRGTFGLKKGNPTSDKIFALSVEEAEKYFSNDNDRMAAPTGYAKKKGCYVSDRFSLPTGEKTGWWWLRSPGVSGFDAAPVVDNGLINQYGDLIFSLRVAVRPAFWLNL